MDKQTAKMIEVKDVEKDIDYAEFYFFISRFMHEIKSYGVDKFMEFYEANIEQCKIDMYNTEYRILLSILQTYSSTFNQTANFDKYIIDIHSYNKLFRDRKEIDFEKLRDKSLKPFYRNGIIISKIDKVVGT